MPSTAAAAQQQYSPHKLPSETMQHVSSKTKALIV
jgi:hypothetical protein